MLNRSRTWLTAMLLLIGAAGLLQLAVADSSPPEDAVLDNLHKKLAALEARIQALEAQLSGVHPAGGTAAAPLAAEPLPIPDDPAAGRVPPTWKTGEINGLRFYTLPLSTAK